jgi:hypothetical protein
MATRAGSGSSTRGESKAAAAEAVGTALGSVNGAPPAFGLLFASPEHNLADALAAARATVPQARWLGCTTAGEITERGLTRGGLSAFLVTSDAMSVHLATAENVAGDPVQAGRTLCAGFAETAKENARRGLAASTTLLLVDGLNGAGEQLLHEVMGGTRVLQQVVGGAAGDAGAFKATHVGGGERTATDAAAALHAFTARPWGVGLGHGLEPASDKMRVTRARRNVVQEIEGRPAFEVYRDYAHDRGVDLKPESAGPFLIGHEIGIYVFDEVRKARAPLSVGSDGSITCAAEVPQGASICILDGKPERMFKAARAAAEEAKRNLAGAEAAGIILFDCVCRGMILDREFGREIEAVQSVFPGAPIAGFLTYGEIARFKGRLEGWHNTTAVVVAIPA